MKEENSVSSISKSKRFSSILLSIFSPPCFVLERLFDIIIQNIESNNLDGKNWNKKKSAYRGNGKRPVKKSHLTTTKGQRDACIHLRIFS